MIKLKIHQLESFWEVAETGSFRQAAERIHRSPSAVSSHIRELEAQLEVTLFERTTRSMLLTPEGRLLLSRCQRIFSDLGAAAQDVRDEAAARRGQISVGISPSISRQHLLPVIVERQKEYPNLALEMHEAFADTLYAQLADRTTDFALGPRIAGLSDFHVRPIIEDPIVAILPRKFPVSSTGTITLERISTQTQICMPSDTAIRRVVERSFKEKRLVFHPKFEVMYPQDLFEMVAAGIGVAMMPLLSVPALPHRDFKIAGLADASLSRDMCLITFKARKLSAPARKLADLFIHTLKNTLGDRQVEWLNIPLSPLHEKKKG